MAGVKETVSYGKNRITPPESVEERKEVGATDEVCFPP